MSHADRSRTSSGPSPMRDGITRKPVLLPRLPDRPDCLSRDSRSYSLADWEAVRQFGEGLRAFELWLDTPDGLEAMAPYRQITRLEAGNTKLRRKIEKRGERALASPA